MFGQELLQAGAINYHGVESSHRMYKLAAQNLKDLSATLTLASIESYDYSTQAYDLVTSRLVLHYVKNIEMVFQEIYRSLKSNGKFVFSVQHPLTTSSFISKSPSEKRENWIVDDYFKEGERQELWMDQLVAKQHRSVESYFTALTKAGFEITALREGRPCREYFQEEAEYERRKRIPLILAFSCLKK